VRRVWGWLVRRGFVRGRVGVGEWEVRERGAWRSGGRCVRADAAVEEGVLGGQDEGAVHGVDGFKGELVSERGLELDGGAQCAEVRELGATR